MPAHLVIAMHLFHTLLKEERKQMDNQPALAHIDTYLEKKRQALRLPGLAVAIIQDGSIAYVRGFGIAATGREMTPQTPFIIGSLSKSFTALAAMQLVEAGQLHLDDPIKRYIPWLRFETVSAERLTIRHLLTHTS